MSEAISVIYRAPVHLARLIKAILVAFYNSAMQRAERTQRGDNKSHRFASECILLPDAIKHQGILNRGYRDEPELQRMAFTVRDFTMVSYEGLCTLGDQVRFCEETNIPGDLVELGTWKGGCLAMMAQANLKWGKSRRTLRGFDSFQGLPRPRLDKDYGADIQEFFKVSEGQSDGALIPINALEADISAPLRILEEVGYPKENVKFHAGWFQETVPKVNIEKIAVLRLDGDFYDSYAVPLEYLYDRVTLGGFIVIDDWVLRGCREAVADFFAKRQLAPYLSHVDGSVRYFRKL